MRNRRAFFKVLAGAAAGMYVSQRAGGGDPLTAVQAPSARRQVMIGGRRVRVVDVHAHWDMPLGDIVKGTPFEERTQGRRDSKSASRSWTRWGSTSQRSASTTSGGRRRRTRGWRAPSATHHNETLAKWRAHPDRFVGMASVPLQFPELAAEMLQDAVKRLGARGVTVGGHVNGESCHAAEVRPVLGEGRGDGRARVHASRTAPPTSSRRARWPDAAAWATSSATRSRRRCSCRG